MITNRSIEQVKDAANIVDVVKHFVGDLKHNKCCCPFHNERSASFSVNPVRNYYKCFGCGASGDSIKFVMEKEGLGFIEAIKWLAHFLNITLEYEQLTEEKKKEYDKKTELLLVNEAATKQYCKQLQSNDLVVKYLKEERGLSDDTIDEFELGFAPDSWDFLSRKIIDANQYDNGIALGLIRTSTKEEQRTYDFFRNRVMFPLRDRRGNVVGFSARHWLADQEGGKYMNSSDSLIYSKQSLLYGIYQASKTIRSLDKVYIVEGNIDVLMMHQHGLRNTVAPCGTALTPQQLAHLKQFAQKVVLMFDNDEAGIKAAMKSIDLCVENAFRVRVVELPMGEDPDSFLRKTTDAPAVLAKMEQDGILWKAKAFLDAADGPEQRSIAIKDVAALLAKIPDEVERDEYTNALVGMKKYKLKSRQLNSAVERSETNVPGDNDDNYRFHDGVDVADAYVDGFYPLVVDKSDEQTGYWFNTGSSFSKVSNFVLRPIFHLTSNSDDKRLIEIQNAFEKKVFDMPSRQLISLEMFQGMMFEKGNFIFWGTKVHLMKIINKISSFFPQCSELKKLGWQPEGFFAYSNSIFNGELKKYDDNGVVEVDGKNYYSPSASNIYSGLRTDDDEFENDRFLEYKKSPVTFAEWCTLLSKAYPGKAEVGIAIVIMAVYRDLVFKMDNNCPMPFCYGQKGSGKSKFAESLANVFTVDMPPFNANYGTEFALSNLLGRFRNCLVQIEEVDANTVKEERMQTFKGIYDGTGRQRGKGGSRNKTEIIHINSIPVYTGQYLPTWDDNAFLMRCLVLDFSPPKGERPDEQRNAFDELKAIEKKGINSIITELLPHRKDIEREYSKVFSDVSSELRDYFSKKKWSSLERVLRNYAAVLTVYRLFDKRVNLPFTVEHIKEYCVQQVHKLSNLVAESDMLADFWRTLEYLVETQQIQQGLHFKVKSTTSVHLQVNRDKREHRELGDTKRVLYLRLGTIHQLYMESFRKKSGRTGIDLNSLKLYLSNNAGWIGTCPSERFSGSQRKADASGFETIEVNSSCMMFDYTLLNVELDRSEGTADEVENPKPAEKPRAMQDDLPF